MDRTHGATEPARQGGSKTDDSPCEPPSPGNILAKGSISPAANDNESEPLRIFCSECGSELWHVLLVREGVERVARLLCENGHLAQ